MDWLGLSNHKDGKTRREKGRQNTQHQIGEILNESQRVYDKYNENVYEDEDVVKYEVNADSDYSRNHRNVRLSFSIDAQLGSFWAEKVHVGPQQVVPAADIALDDKADVVDHPVVVAIQINVGIHQIQGIHITYHPD